MKQRAFVVTINTESETPDIDVAQDIMDAVEDAGYPVLSVNPFGGEESSTVTNKINPTVAQPQSFGTTGAIDQFGF